MVWRQEAAVGAVVVQEARQAAQFWVEIQGNLFSEVSFEVDS